MKFYRIIGTNIKNVLYLFGRGIKSENDIKSIFGQINFLSYKGNFSTVRFSSNDYFKVFFTNYATKSVSITFNNVRDKILHF